MNDNNKNNDIEVVTGNGSDLDISPVYDHIKIDKPSTTKDKKKEIVVPKSNSNNDK